MANKKSTRKSNGEGSVFQDKNGRWIAKIMDGTKQDGTPHMKSFTAKTRKEVVAKLDNYKMLMKGGISKQPKTTLATYMDNWLTNVESKTLLDTSYTSQYNIAQNHIVATIGHYYMKDLTSDIIQQEVINNLQNEGYSYTLLTRVYSILNKCLEYASLKKHIECNWCKLVFLPNKKHWSQAKKYTIWSDEQIEQFLNECFRISDSSHTFANYYGMLYSFLLLTGLRIGEALGLKWDCVDLENKTIRIERIAITQRYSQEDKKYKKEMIVHDRTKTDESVREIPLCDKAIECLNNIKINNNNNIKFNDTNIQNKDFVFLNKNGNIPYPDNLLEGLKILCNRIGIENTTLHLLRHNFGSILFRNKVDIVTVSRLMGHKTPSITLNTYIDVLSTIKSEGVKVFDRY